MVRKVINNGKDVSFVVTLLCLLHTTLGHHVSMLHELCWGLSLNVERLSWWKPVSFFLFFRPLGATNTDKLDLQECLEHGRTAKVVVCLPVVCPLSNRPIFAHVFRPPSVRQGEDHHHQVQFHQAGQGPALPRLHEREGGHTLVQWDREVKQLPPVLCRLRASASNAVLPRPFLSGSVSDPAGSSGSRSTTRTCPTWAAWRGRGCWAGRGACRSFATSLHPWKNTLRASKRQLKDPSVPTRNKSLDPQTLT